MESDQRTIYDIAEEAGVSIASVSRVLSGHPNVSAKMRKKVMAVVERHQFTPNSIAQGLDTGKTHVIGVIVPDVINPYYMALYAAASEAAELHGYDVWLYQLSAKRTTVSEEVVRQLIKRRLDGAFFVGGILEAEDGEIVRAISLLRRYMPVVAVCPPIADLNCTCLYNDLATAIQQAIFHLHNLGHQRIAFLGGSRQVRTSGARGRGFLEAMAQVGMQDDPEYHHEAGYTSDAGEIAVSKLLSCLPRKRWPTALVCFNDLIALGAMKALRQMQLRVPEDMAIIGCDNSYFAPYTNPPLTTIDLHPKAHAYAAIDELLRSGALTAASFSQAREATLIVRESCGVKLGRRNFDG